MSFDNYLNAIEEGKISDSLGLKLYNNREFVHRLLFCVVVVVVVRFLQENGKPGEMIDQILERTIETLQRHNVASFLVDIVLEASNRMENGSNDEVNLPVDLWRCCELGSSTFHPEALQTRTTV